MIFTTLSATITATSYLVSHSYAADRRVSFLPPWNNEFTGGSVFFLWMFISVPGTATSQVNIHAVMQHDRYMGGKGLLFMDATLTKEMVTDCAMATRNNMPYATAMISITSVVT